MSLLGLVQRVKSAYNRDMPFDETAVLRDTAGRFSERTGAAAEVTLVSTAAPELVAALERYGLTVDDVPLDHEGQSIIGRWTEKFESLGERQLTTMEDHLNNELKLDFGRLESGPWLAWPDLGKPLEKWPTVRAGDSWTGRTPVAMVHTRNGAGGRYCYCDDGDNHDSDCLAAVVENLQKHPAFIVDEDNTLDSTYANFAFKVDRDAAQALFETSAQARNQEQARNLQKSIAEGHTAPWVVFPRNPVTVERITELREQTKKLGHEDLLKDNNRLPSGLQTRGLPSQEHLDALDAKLAVLNGDLDQTSAASTNVWYYDKYSNPHREWEGYVKAVQATEAVAAANEALADPATPPALAHALTSALDTPLGISFDAKKLEEKTTRIAKMKELIEADRAIVHTVMQRRGMREYMTREARELEKNVTWPGSGNAPSRVQ
jgi:hypothetical protein